MWKEFKDFIAKGNVLDLAVGIIIGGAFGKIVSSLVGDIIMPVVGLFAGKINFANLFMALDFNSYESLDAAKKASAPVLMYGNFLQSIIDFLIIGFAVFMIVKMANKAKDVAPISKRSESQASAPPTTKDCPQCLSKIPATAKKCAYCCSEQS